MDPQRITAKLLLADATGLDLETLIPVFHSWIQRSAIDGLLIDVADYKHVPDGPGIMLIGDQADYALDIGEGGPGFQVAWKRGLEGDLTDRIRRVVGALLTAAEVLAGESSLSSAADLRTDTLLVRIADRLDAPNTPETLAAIGPAITDALAPILGFDARLDQRGDSRRPFTVTVDISGGSVAELRERFAVPAPA